MGDYAERDGRIRVLRRRSRIGPVASFQHALQQGDADFVLPQTTGNVIAPDFLAKTMRVMLAEPDCAMCHARGARLSGAGEPHNGYPPEHSLRATGRDPVARARHVMRRYASVASLWGVFRRSASDRLSPLRHCFGWDRVLLAELALHGEIRHVPELLYWHADSGTPPPLLAHEVSEQARSGLPAADPLGDPRWRIPLIAAAFAHIETFATARLDLESRRALIAEVAPIFRQRWLSRMTEEALLLRDWLPGRIATYNGEDEAVVSLATSKCLLAIAACEAILPEIDFSPLRTALVGSAPAVVSIAA
jgi:hypothetical protein